MPAAVGDDARRREFRTSHRSILHVGGHVETSACPQQAADGDAQPIPAARASPPYAELPGSLARLADTEVVAVEYRSAQQTNSNRRRSTMATAGAKRRHSLLPLSQQAVFAASLTFARNSTA